MNESDFLDVGETGEQYQGGERLCVAEFIGICVLGSIFTSGEALAFALVHNIVARYSWLLRFVPTIWIFLSLTSPFKACSPKIGTDIVSCYCVNVSAAFTRAWSSTHSATTDMRFAKYLHIA